MREERRYELNRLKKIKKKLLQLQLEEQAERREQQAYKKMAKKR